MDSAASSPASTSSRVARNLFHMSPVKHYSYGTDSDECATPLQLSSPEISPDKPRYFQRTCRRNLISPNKSPSLRNSPVLRLTNQQDCSSVNESPRSESPGITDISTSGLMTPFKRLGNQNKMVIEESPDVVTTTPQNKKPPSKHTSFAQFYSPSSGISVGSFYSTGKPKARLSLLSVSSFAVPRPTKRSRSATADNRCRVKRAKVEGPRLGNCRSHVAFKKLKRSEPQKKNSAESPPQKKIPALSPQDRMDLAEIDQVMADINRPKLAPITLNAGTKRPRPTEKPAEVLKSPEIDPKKKFFKTNRTMEVNRKATVTIDKSMRFEVSNGKFTLQKAKRGPRALFAPSESKVCVEHVQRKVAAIIESLGGTADDAVVPSLPSEVLVPLPPTPTPPKQPMPVSPLSSPDTKMAAITSSTSKMALGEGAEAPAAGLFPLFYKDFVTPKDSSPQSPRAQRAAKRSVVPTEMGQMQIDAGQRRFGHTLCSGCNLLYQMGEPEEEARHREYHNRHRAIKFTGWKQERVVNLYDMDDFGGGGRVVEVTASDSKTWWRKVEQVMEAVDEEIGSLPGQPMNELPSVKVLLYISGDRVVGCIIGQALQTANRVLPSIDGLQCCSEEEHPVIMGISRIWVANDWRLRKVATRLVDCLRSTFVYGAVLSMNDFAFSVPTDAGSSFAQKYTGVEDFLVYS